MISNVSPKLKLIVPKATNGPFIANTGDLLSIRSTNSELWSGGDNTDNPIEVQHSGLVEN